VRSQPERLNIHRALRSINPHQGGTNAFPDSVSVHPGRHGHHPQPGRGACVCACLDGRSHQHLLGTCSDVPPEPGGVDPGGLDVPAGLSSVHPVPSGASPSPSPPRPPPAIAPARSAPVAPSASLAPSPALTLTLAPHDPRARVRGSDQSL